MEREFFYIAVFSDDEDGEHLREILKVSGPGDEKEFKKAWNKALQSAKETWPNEWKVSDVFGILCEKRHEIEPWVIEFLTYTEVTY
jgi:hypothetical protein